MPDAVVFSLSRLAAVVADRLAPLALTLVVSIFSTTTAMRSCSTESLLRLIVAKMGASSESSSIRRRWSMRCGFGTCTASPSSVRPSAMSFPLSTSLKMREREGSMRLCCMARGRLGITYLVTFESVIALASAYPTLLRRSVMRSPPRLAPSGEASLPAGVCSSSVCHSVFFKPTPISDAS